MNNQTDREATKQKRIAFIKSLDRPPVLVGLMIIAVIAASIGWITFEMATLCFIAGIVGIVMHIKKKK